MKMHRCALKGCKTQIASKFKYCGPEHVAEARSRAKSLVWPGGKPPEKPVPTVEGDRKLAKAVGELAGLKGRYKDALHTIEMQAQQLETFTALNNGDDSFVIEPKHGSGTSEGTVVMPFSDLHFEELVGREVGGLNSYSPEIALASGVKFFNSGVRLIKLLQQDIKIETLVLPLLGDYITGQIHGAENAEKNAMPPVEALLAVKKLITSGFDFILNNTKVNIVSPCHSGNHARTTKTTRFGSEAGHSLEFILYHWLQTQYANEPRVTFIIPEGIHSYLDVYDTTIRFQHGHAIKYGGGVGGIYIPVNKAIGQWNKARWADLDVFGHFHQLRDGGNFICNGSVIGYNAFALSIKADPEEPKQALFLMDKKRGRTCTWPILVR